jgi:hypothetical protein
MGHYAQYKGCCPHQAEQHPIAHCLVKHKLTQEATTIHGPETESDSESGIHRFLGERCGHRMSRTACRRDQTSLYRRMVGLTLLVVLAHAPVCPTYAEKVMRNSRLLYLPLEPHGSHPPDKHKASYTLGCDMIAESHGSEPRRLHLRGQADNNNRGRDDAAAMVRRLLAT